MGAKAGRDKTPDVSLDSLAGQPNGAMIPVMNAPIVNTRRPLSTFLLAALLAGAGLAPASAQDSRELPGIGSSAETIFTAAQESEYGAMVFRELRRYGYLQEDPQLVDYLNKVGHRLAAHNPDPIHSFTFFFIRTRDINASSWPGGFISINAGLMLTAESESELAAVMAHEIAHTTQRHIARMIEKQSRDQLPLMLAMLGTVVAAANSGSSSASDATGAAIMGFMGLMQQLQINHTRSNEHEADRIGIRTLAAAGYDPMSMASFFGRMHRANRTVGLGLPEYLRSHPVTTTRISEAKDRAGALQPSAGVAAMPTNAPANPLLPDAWLAGLRTSQPLQQQFAWARERLRVLSADSPSEMESHYRRRLASSESPLPDAERYGYALALMGVGQHQAALQQLEAINEEDPGHFWVSLAKAEALHRGGRVIDAELRYEQLLASHPRNRAIALSYATALLERDGVEQGRRAQAVLRPLLSSSADDPALQRSFGRASEVAGDLVRAGEAHAEYAFLTGSAVDAVKQLEALKKRDDLDFYQRARIDARIAAMTPTALEDERRGLRGPQRLETGHSHSLHLLESGTPRGHSPHGPEWLQSGHPTKRSLR